MWNRDGDLAVEQGSVMITGTGTTFNTEKVGFAVQIEGETRIHEIRRISSDLSIELYEPIERADASGLSFRIWPTQGLEVDIRRNLINAMTLLTNIKSDLALGVLALWEAEPGNENGTVAEFLADLVGPQGDSAHQVWLDEGNTGTKADFLDDISGGAVTATAANLTAALAAQVATEAARDTTITKAAEASVDAVTASTAAGSAGVDAAATAADRADVATDKAAAVAAANTATAKATEAQAVRDEITIPMLQVATAITQTQTLILESHP